MLCCLLLTTLLAADHPGLELIIVDISRDDCTAMIAEIGAWEEAYSKLPANHKPNEPIALAKKVYNHGDTAIPFLMACLRQAEFDRQSGLTDTKHLPRAAILWVLSGSTIARNIGISGEDTDEESTIWQVFWQNNYTHFLINHKPIDQYWDPFAIKN